jgi:hypothetical protein
MTAAADQALLNKLNAAVAEHNAAEQAVTTAQSELVSKSKVVGQLLLEAKKRHPKVTDFEAFLKRVNGLKLSRAYDLLRLAGGRTTDEELRKDQRERVRKHRAKKKIPAQPKSITKPEPISVTDPHVTESPKRITQSPEISVDQRRTQNAALDTEPRPTPPVSELKRQVKSHLALADFKIACKTYLPLITDPADQWDALMFIRNDFPNLTSNFTPKTRAA